MQSRIDIGDTAIIAVTRYPLLWEGNLLQGLMDGGIKRAISGQRRVRSKLRRRVTLLRRTVWASPARGGGRWQRLLFPFASVQKAFCIMPKITRCVVALARAAKWRAQYAECNKSPGIFDHDFPGDI